MLLLRPTAVLLLSCQWCAHPVQPRPAARRVPPPLAASRGGEDEALADLVAGLQPVLTRVLAAWYQPHVCAVRTGGPGQPALCTIQPREFPLLTEWPHHDRAMLQWSHRRRAGSRKGTRSVRGDWEPVAYT